MIERVIKIFFYHFKYESIKLKTGFICIISIITISFPSLIYSQEVRLYIDKFEFEEDGIRINLNIENSLPEDRPDISGERIKYIDKGSEVKLIYRIKMYKKGWWIFNDTVTIQRKSEIIITRTLKKDIITKFYTVREYSNISGIEGLVEETEFNGSVLDKEFYKKEKLKKLRETFFEKELSFSINYDIINLQVGGSYYIETKTEYQSYVPIFGTGEPRNFYTNTVKSNRITFNGFIDNYYVVNVKDKIPDFSFKFRKLILYKLSPYLKLFSSG